MNEKNNKRDHLSLKELISESLIRDVILFIFLFLLIIAQGWNNILLLIFPMLSFIFSIFFRIISCNKTKTEFKDSFVLYNPLGLEKKHANRLFFCTLFQLILLLWIGGESLYNPHLSNRYFPFFSIIFVFFFTFGFFWIFIDLWKYTKIEILIDTIEDKIQKYKSQDFTENVKKIITSLKLERLRMTPFLVFAAFIIMNIINVILILLNNSNDFVLEINLPGFQNQSISYIFFVILIISPALSAILLYLNYKAINNINIENLNSIIESLPRNHQVKILESLKAINNKINEQLKIE
ncbi:MAG: hypothetical protein ACFFEY_03245 [Candidatus Thorarchaeota archaeon]